MTLCTYLEPSFSFCTILEQQLSELLALEIETVLQFVLFWVVIIIYIVNFICREKSID